MPPLTRRQRRTQAELALSSSGDDGKRPPPSPPAADACAICGEAAPAADEESAQAESCRLHRCHLTCLAAWLETASTDRAGRCPAPDCGAGLGRISVRGAPGAPEDTLEPALLRLNCPVCLERLSGPVATPDTCPGHQFCPPCLRNCTKHSRLCPFDRRPYGAIILRARSGSKVVIAREPLPPLPPALADPDPSEVTDAFDVLRVIPVYFIIFVVLTLVAISGIELIANNF